MPIRRPERANVVEPFHDLPNINVLRLAGWRSDRSFGSNLGNSVINHIGPSLGLNQPHGRLILGLNTLAVDSVIDIDGGVNFVVEVNVFELEGAQCGGKGSDNMVAIGWFGGLRRRRRSLVVVHRVAPLSHGIPAVGASSLLLGAGTTHEQNYQIETEEIGDEDGEIMCYVLRKNVWGEKRSDFLEGCENFQGSPGKLEA